MRYPVQHPQRPEESRKQARVRHSTCHDRRRARQLYHTDIISRLRTRGLAPHIFAFLLIQLVFEGRIWKGFLGGGTL